MAMTRRRKICIALAVVLLVIFLVLPLVLGAAMRGTVEQKIGDATKAPVKLGGLSIKLLPPGAVLSGLEVGSAVPEAGGAPLAKIGSLSASVSWSTVFGGATHVTSLGIYDADITLSCDEKGTSNFVTFMDNMGPSDRKDPLPIDSLVLKNAKVTCYVPQKLLAPKSSAVPDPAVVQLGYVGLDGLVVPPPGQPPSGEWMDVEVERLHAVAPLRAVEAPASPAEAGPPLEEGLNIEALALSIALPTPQAPMKIRDGQVSGLRLRNVLHSANTPETLSRIIWSLQLASGNATAVKSKREVVAERRAMSAEDKGSVVIQNFQLKDAMVELTGPDASGNTAFYRLTKLEADIRDFAWGLGAAVPAGAKGQLHIASPSTSSAGEGQLLVDWKDIEGEWPKQSFEAKEELKGFALAPLSARVEQRSGAGIQGTMDMTMAGPTSAGAIHWDGTVTLSKDTKLVGKSVKGHFLNVASNLTGGLNKVATGEPIPGFGVRGTLDKPDPKWPPILGDALAEFAQQIALEPSVSVTDILKEGSGDVLQKGVGGGKELLKKVPGLGDFLNK